MQQINDSVIKSPLPSLSIESIKQSKKKRNKNTHGLGKKLKITRAKNNKENF